MGEIQQLEGGNKGISVQITYNHVDKTYLIIGRYTISIMKIMNNVVYLLKSSNIFIKV